MAVEVRRTDDAHATLAIARRLSSHFNAEGLRAIEADIQTHILNGAFDGSVMLGFATYKPLNADTVEMTWLGVDPGHQRRGVGRRLVEESLAILGGEYRLCQVKTLADSDPYAPYAVTRAFYRGLGFLPLETISPYPGWGENPCQLWVKVLR